MKFPKNPPIRLSRTKWIALKKYVFNRDKFCIFCGSAWNNTPAHVINKSQSGDDSPNNLVRACVKCHNAFDKYEIELPAKTVEMLRNEPKHLEDI